MSTPLYRYMKERGTSFYAFPSTSKNPNPKFSKFVLLNIPAAETKQILDFDSNLSIFDIHTDQLPQSLPYSEYLIQSLRNYVANHDTTMRESKLNQISDFYNISEPITPTEKIFWKWLRKFNAIDLEPAQHKIDWNKNLPDFENPNADTFSNTDHFRKYLWKEREKIEYNIDSTTTDTPNVGQTTIHITFPAKFKKGDYVIVYGDYGGGITEKEYEVEGIEETSNSTDVVVDEADSTVTMDSIKLKYHKLVQYIGEINVQSDVNTATKDETEVTAYIPHQAGKTPTVMWGIESDTNYYPGLELPILPEQIQPEIRGAENLQSPIRQNPGDYPGLYFGQFDDSNKTYKSSVGDKVRYSGEYYGILRNNNVGLSSDNYVERLSEFNSDNIDGLSLDFNLNHYLKMGLLPDGVGFNFDEFNQLSIDGEPPQSFEYNAILWYYEEMTNDDEVEHNLYGVTFLNNPDQNDDIDPDHISTYEKLTQSDEHDGTSYVHVLNLSTSVDNDTSSLSFDPLTLNNTFGFDLYNNVMSNVGKLNETFINIVNEFVRLNNDLNNVKSVVYSQTDIDLIKNKLKNLEYLLKLYSTYQFVDSESVKIQQDFSGVYPTLSFDVKGVEYEDVISIKSSYIKSYIDSGEENYLVNVPQTNKLYLKITNDDISDYGELDILFDKDFGFKQSATIYIDADKSIYSNKLNFYINYNTGTSDGTEKREFIDNIYLPNDIDDIISGNINYSKSKWISKSLEQYSTLVTTTGDTSTAMTVLYTPDADMFGHPLNSQSVYIYDFLFENSEGEIEDFTGVYEVGPSDYTPIYIKIELNTNDKTPIGIPKICIYKGIKIDILRVDESPTSSIKDRYLIEKTLI